LRELKLTAVSLRRWCQFDEVELLLAACLADLDGIERFVRPGQMVVVKPNLTEDAPASSGGTTHVELVEALLRQVQRCQPAWIVVAEGTGAFGNTHETAFLHGGWREMAERIWKRSEIHGQYLLEEVLADINRIRKPDSSVVDGWDGSEGVAGGDSFRCPAGARVMMVGADPVAVDVVSRELMGQKVRTRYLEWAIEDGVGIGDPDAIEIRGDTLDACRHHFMSPIDELGDTMPLLKVHDQGACSGCRCLVTSALRRMQTQKMLQPLQVVFGGEGELPQLDGRVIVFGKCAQPFAASGTCLEGCPPSGEAVMSALDKSECFCHKCPDMASAILASSPAELLAHLRVAASGRQIHVGQQVKRHEWHLVLLVGDCMQRYAQINIERAAQFGLNAEPDLAWIQGCPAEEGDVRAAVERLKESLASVLSTA
jgi:uncharacterized protein (DUF362 family)